MKKQITTILLGLLFLTGLSLLLYPTVSDYWNSLHQSRAIASYAEAVEQMNTTDYEALREEARKYNEALLENDVRLSPTEEQKEWYNKLLNVTGTGIMGYIEIPSIQCSLPIYHGVEDTVLQIAVGHIEGTSLPVGGESTHAVLSGHRGLPSARLFTDLDKLAEGDTFLLHVLDETLTYQVDQIRIVEPDNVDDLAIEEGKDLCTLVTCTPYGINSHRLLVRGHRIETEEEAAAVYVQADATQIDPLYVAPLVAIPMLVILFIWLFVGSGRGASKKKHNNKNGELRDKMDDKK
ncbi:MAG: class C sortase [bacterium]|nr:class C sortase [bacterium]